MIKLYEYIPEYEKIILHQWPSRYSFMYMLYNATSKNQKAFEECSEYPFKYDTNIYAALFDACNRYTGWKLYDEMRRKFPGFTDTNALNMIKHIIRNHYGDTPSGLVHEYIELTSAE